MSQATKDLTSLLHERRSRATPQRLVVLQALSEAGGHSTPTEIYQRVVARAPGVNRATVYRTLDFLCELRLIVATRIGRKMYYEIAKDKKHHHLVCRNCGKVLEIGPEVIAGLLARIERERHFTVDMDHLALFGLCERCRRVG